MSGRLLGGSPASEGIAFGVAWRRAEAVRPGSLIAWEDQEHERDTALRALTRAGRALSEMADAMTGAEAEIVEAGALMARDPALVNAVEEAVLGRRMSAADAILAATEHHARQIAAIGDEMLAARADDVRSLGRRAALLSTDSAAEGPPDGDVILIADDLGPADVAELASSLAGIALARGGPTAHAAIVARSLGIPMVTGLTDSILSVGIGVTLVIDGSRGTVAIDPPENDAVVARDQTRARRAAHQLSAVGSDEPAVTIDGHRVTVLANVASRAELEVALPAGAEGIGLLRTELAFLEAESWPAEQEHTDFLKPVLEALGDRPAVVRVLDFGADKVPPFLHSVRERGIELLLANTDALVGQLRAIQACARGRDVRILLPMVESPAQVSAVRAMIEQTSTALGVACLPLGAMIETPLAVNRAPQLARVADFFSIGTNDLTASTLGSDRFADNDARTYDPQVLREIARSVAAAHSAGLSIEVCGEAASDPLMVPLLVGLGIDGLSVGAARVGQVREWVRRLSHVRAGDVAAEAIQLETLAGVERLVAPLAVEIQSAQAGDGLGERIESSGSIHAVGS